MLPDHGWLRVTETVGSKTVDKERLLYKLLKKKTNKEFEVPSLHMLFPLSRSLIPLHTLEYFPNLNLKASPPPQ